MHGSATIAAATCGYESVSGNWLRDNNRTEDPFLNERNADAVELALDDPLGSVDAPA
jgi:hypothetical protein